MENKSLFMSFYVLALSFQFLKIINYSYFENCWCTSWKTSSKEKLFWNNYGAFMINYWVRSNIDVYTNPAEEKRKRTFKQHLYWKTTWCWLCFCAAQDLFISYFLNAVILKNLVYTLPALYIRYNPLLSDMTRYRMINQSKL